MTSMTSDKRQMSTYFDNDYDDFFQIKKKSYSPSLETNDSTTKEESSLSPIILKPNYPENIEIPDPLPVAAKEKAQPQKPGSSHKRKQGSSQLTSNDDIIQDCMRDPSHYIDTFKVFKFKDVKYKIGATMLVRNEADVYNDFVCKLIRIIKPKKAEHKKVMAFLEIQWYYKREDLPKKYAAFLPHLSFHEVFLSTHKDFIMIDCINGPCQILKYSEFDKLETIHPATYFTRASYDAGRKKLDPPIEGWEKYCVCKNPLNPDLSYIQCDKCEGWYHLDCVGLSKEETNAIEHYFCKSCQEKKGLGQGKSILKLEKPQEEKLQFNMSQAVDSLFKNDEVFKFDDQSSQQGFTDIFFESFDHKDLIKVSVRTLVKM